MNSDNSQSKKPLYIAIFITITLLTVLIVVGGIFYLNYSKGDDKTDDTKTSTEEQNDNSETDPNTVDTEIVADDTEVNLQFDLIDTSLDMQIARDDYVDLLEDNMNRYEIYDNNDQPKASIFIASKDELDRLFPTDDQELSYSERTLIYYSANQCNVLGNFYESFVNSTTITYGSSESDPTCEVDDMLGAAWEVDEQYIFIAIVFDESSNLIPEIVDAYFAN